MTAFVVAGLVAALLATLWWYVRRLFTYWERRGVPTVAPRFPYGNFATLGKQHCHQELMKEMYDRLKPTGAPFAGVYALCKPIALLIDIDLIKRVLVTDFDVFHDRGVYHNADVDPLSANLLTIEGQLWRDVRAKLTGIFTANKMRLMFGMVGDVADDLVRTIRGEAADRGGVVELKDLVGGFMTDVIGVCAFGLDLNSLQGADPVFRNYGKKTFDKPRNHPVHQLLLTAFPRVGRAFGCRTIHEDIERFYLGLVRRTIAYREQNQVKRNDFMDLMIELRNAQSNDGLRLSVEQIAAESYAFFLAGLGTTSSLLSFVLYELAMSATVQRRLRAEIAEVMSRNATAADEVGGGLSYDAIGEMTYLTQVINEALRKYPPFGNTIRQAKRDYRVPGTDLVIEKGTTVWTPVMGLHHDPQFYPEPERFDPERFSATAMKQRDPMVFLPFGGGPRKCLGYRFALMVARLALVKMMCAYRFDVCTETNVPLLISKKFVLYEPTGGVTLAVTELTELTDDERAAEGGWRR